ncbi:MAG TPA: hypothetical protein VFS05_09995 [Gemmatimonadaceae bacterium]|nr:hypothetical protein [Gemmatimonadaceae bacterium]
MSTGNAAPEGEASASRTPERRLPRIITAPPAAGRDHRPRRPFFFPGGSCAIPPCFCATWPAGAFFYPFGYASSYYDAPLRSAEDERPPSRPKIIEGAPEPAYGELRIEALGDSLLRLSRPSSTRPVQEVRFFVADAQQQVLAQQVITAAPFTAVFAATPVALFAGVETVFPDGARTAVILPLRPVPAR